MMRYEFKEFGKETICPICSKSFIMNEDTNFLVPDIETQTYKYTCSLKCFNKYSKSHPSPKKQERVKSQSQILKEKKQEENLAHTMAILNKIHEDNKNREVVYATSSNEVVKKPNKTHGNCGKVWVVNIEGCKRVDANEVDEYLSKGYKKGKVFR